MQGTTVCCCGNPSVPQVFGGAIQQKVESTVTIRIDSICSVDWAFSSSDNSCKCPILRRLTFQIHSYAHSLGIQCDMGWLRLVGSIKKQVSFAEYSLFYRALLQKRPIFLKEPTHRSHPIAVHVLGLYPFLSHNQCMCTFTDHICGTCIRVCTFNWNAMWQPATWKRACRCVLKL